MCFTSSTKQKFPTRRGTDAATTGTRGSGRAESRSFLCSSMDRACTQHRPCMHPHILLPTPCRACPSNTSHSRSSIRRRQRAAVSLSLFGWHDGLNAALARFLHSLTPETLRLASRVRCRSGHVRLLNMHRRLCCSGPLLASLKTARVDGCTKRGYGASV